MKPESDITLKERLIVQFEPEQLERLRALAAARGVSLAALVRAATDELLERQDLDQRWERAMKVVGTARRLAVPNPMKPLDAELADAIGEEVDRQSREWKAQRHR